MRKYVVTFRIEVDMSVEDELVTRAEDVDFPYTMDEDETVEMLADCVGLRDWSLSQMDGWADCSDNQINARRRYLRTEVKRIN